MQSPIGSLNDLFVSISALSDRGLLRDGGDRQSFAHSVSISALSDRGLLLSVQATPPQSIPGFNIRSFGSWIASIIASWFVSNLELFQYPLFRIVDCFSLTIHHIQPQCSFNIRSFGSWIASLSWSESVTLQRCFNIRSFGSWIASYSTNANVGHASSFNIRSFGSWIASNDYSVCARGG